MRRWNELVGKYQRVPNAATQVLEEAAVNPVQLVRNLEISKFSIYRILKSLKFQGYKTQLAQEINKDDPDKRTQFLEVVFQSLMNFN